jgi:hypothetical protein
MAKKQTARGRKQDRARVAGSQDYEVRYEAKKTRSTSSVISKTIRSTDRLTNDPETVSLALVIGRS